MFACLAYDDLETNSSVLTRYSQERNWKDKLDELEGSLAKLRNEESIERARLKEEITKFEVRYPLQHFVLAT